MRQRDMSGDKLMVCAANAPQMRYSAAYPTDAERNEPSRDVGLARLSSVGGYSVFSYGDDVIRFATSPRLVKYTRIKHWDDGYLEVGADYGKGEVEDYIDIRAILDNLYYDTDAFLSKIDKVEVVYE